MATPIDVVVFKCRKIFLTGNRRNRELFTGQNKFSCKFNAQKLAITFISVIGLS